MTSIKVSLPKWGKPSQSKEISNHISLDFKIQAAVSVHRRRMVDLNQPWLQVGINHDIKAKHLKASIYVRYIILK